MDSPYTIGDSNTPIIIPLWLRDVYAKLGPEPITSMSGPVVASKATEQEAINELAAGVDNSSLFLSATDVAIHLNRRSLAEVCNQVITIFIVSLRNIYWINRELLSPTQFTELQQAMREPTPSFHDIFNYTRLANTKQTMPLYQLFGTITSFNVLDVPVVEFIAAINNRQPLDIRLPELNIIIRLVYEEFDLWDVEQNRLLTRVNICGQ